ncbi:MAG: transcriptional repressor [Firmicutes bacterium]|nr:transcriptional repressor [Bacillota bacterium]
MSTETYENLLHANNLRVTAVRLAILRTLESFPHSDTDFIIGKVRKELGSVSTQAVYNVLSSLCEIKVIRRIEPAGSNALYELRVGDNHHHVVCRVCMAVQDIDCLVGQRPCLQPSDTKGFILDEAEITFWGICPTCQT